MRALVDIARPVFARGLALRTEHPSDAAALASDLQKVVQAFDEAARREGHPARMAEEAVYALSAWLDEVVFASTPISLEWLGHSLVAHRFQDPAAGTTFFERLAGLHRQAEMAGALDVYAQAILLGFQGRYRMEASDDLRRVAEDALGKRNADPSRNAPWLPALEHPAGKRPKERTGRRLWWITIGLPLAALSIYALLAFLVDH
jgi:type IV/VI secretion system ImpK/VasF family protein